MVERDTVGNRFRLLAEVSEQIVAIVNGFEQEVDILELRGQASPYHVVREGHTFDAISREVSVWNEGLTKQEVPFVGANVVEKENGKNTNVSGEFFV